jgi:UDP-N-acetylmuramoyl-tripeptide--D-alanyl-D-alanine ligase
VPSPFCVLGLANDPAFALPCVLDWLGLARPRTHAGHGINHLVLDLTPERIKEVCSAALLAGGPSPAGPNDAPVRAVVDSQQVQKGDLFFGLSGEQVDGGQFVGDAIERGAWGVVARNEHALVAAGTGGGRVRVLSVDDPLVALGRLARAWVDRLWTEGCKVIGITGSTGKTSTKDIMRALLEPALEGKVHASQANYNTEIGLPLAVLEAELGTRALVLEMAMRGPGQIRELCEIAPPDIGVITNIGPVHLELLGTVEAVAEAKAELIAALPPEGVCVVPATAEALRPHLRRGIRTLTFADWPLHDDEALAEIDRVSGAAADIRILSAEALPDDETRTHAEIAVGAVRHSFEFNFCQAHNLVNALAAIGAGHALGIEISALAAGASTVRFSELRGEEVELAEGVLLINDCYNANPISMRAALDHLARVAPTRGQGRTVAVLGDMAELGADATKFHEEIGAHAAERGVNVLVAVGALAGSYVDGYGAAGEVVRAASVDEAADAVAALLRPGDVVLVKASRAVGLERLTESLRALLGLARDASGVDAREGR